MKKLVFMYSVMLLVIVILMVLVNSNAFAQTPPEDQKVVHIWADPDNGETRQALSAPGPGEKLTIIVDVPIRTRKVTRTRVTSSAPHITKQGTDLYMRGGLGVSTVYDGLTTNLASTVGIVGGIGYTNWRFRGRFNVGQCRADTVAVGGSLATMRRLHGNFWVGVGADLLYCSDMKSHPAEKSAKRFIGGSVRMAYERGHFLFEEWIGVTKVTFPIPGGRVNHPAVIGGFSASYLF